MRPRRRRSPGRPRRRSARPRRPGRRAARGRARSASREIAEAGQVQVAGPAVAAHSVLAAVEAEVFDLRTQLQQRRTPGAFAAADIQHAADRSLQVVLGTGHGQRDLARQAGAAADVGAAVPALEVGGVVGLVHGAVHDRGKRRLSYGVAARHASMCRGVRDCSGFATACENDRPSTPAAGASACSATPG
ncbi:hypothetical protein G6F22_017637 [Rhizopus arrhizus]|nr:hypothetical protein G6F22_017637 [Rhizopus arrhizus]